MSGNGKITPQANAEAAGSIDNPSIPLRVKGPKCPSRGGKRPGAGRPHGARDKVTIAREEAIAAKMSEFKGDAVDFLRAVMEDSTVPLNVRLDCAKTLAKFDRPTLSSVTQTTTVKGEVKQLSDAELMAMLVANKGKEDSEHVDH